MSRNWLQIQRIWHFWALIFAISTLKKHGMQSPFKNACWKLKGSLGSYQVTASYWLKDKLSFWWTRSKGKYNSIWVNQSTLNSNSQIFEWNQHVRLLKKPRKMVTLWYARHLYKTLAQHAQDPGLENLPSLEQEWLIVKPGYKKHACVALRNPCENMFT